MNSSPLCFPRHLKTFYRFGLFLFAWIFENLYMYHNDTAADQSLSDSSSSLYILSCPVDVLNPFTLLPNCGLSHIQLA